MDITLGAALLAGIISFLSPCVLPVVPAYLGQLGVVVAHNPIAQPTTSLATAGGPSTATLPAPPARAGWGASGGWRSLPNAIAFVFGFGTVFTLFGAAAQRGRQPVPAVRGCDPGHQRRGAHPAGPEPDGHPPAHGPDAHVAAARPVPG